MKNIGYQILKLWIKSGLYLYYGKIKISGLENVPRNEPVLFLPNHQGALMDVLLMVTDCNRKPFFLTRSDVFGNESVKKFFIFLRMLPIYRIRDGRESLKKNRAVFDECARLLQEKHALVMFPEANHNLKRRVRPLSKGFTRILFNTLEKTPELKIHIIPVGMNYRSNKGFPDKVALYYGMPILANGMYDSKAVQNSSNRIREAVSDSLKTLTTHIEDEENYDTTIKKLDALHLDYLDPAETNDAIKKWDDLPPDYPNPSETNVSSKKMDALPLDYLNHPDTNVAVKNLETFDAKKIDSRSPTTLQDFFKGVFSVLNFPVIYVWRTYIRPKVWEPEFTGTLRFGFALLVYPIYYLILYAVFAAIWSGPVGLTAIAGLFFFNWGYVRWN